MSRPESGPLDGLDSLSLRSERDTSSLYFVDGVRPVLHALDAGVAIERLIYSEILSPAFVQRRVRLAKRSGVRVARVTAEQFRSVCRSQRASGIAAVLRQHWTPLGQADPRSGICWIALSTVRSLGNLGTLLRTAEAVGVGGIVFLGGSTDPFDPDVVRSSMGGIFHLQLVRTELPAFRSWTATHGCCVAGTSPAGRVLYTDIPLDAPLVLLLGNERSGLRPDELESCAFTARIPINGRADSLNVGIAAAVILYDVHRRMRLGAHHTAVTT